jgi:serine/threonine-protein kinase
MDAPPAGPTLLLPHPARGTTGSRHFPTELPEDLLNQSVARLRTLAWLYAFVFFMAGLFPALLFAEARATVFGSPLLWVPPILSILVALVVAGVLGADGLPRRMALRIGPAFEVAGSYGIAAAEFLDPRGPTTTTVSFLGLSWVALWTLLFTVVVPTRPRQALVAALASVSAVPVVFGIGMAAGIVFFLPNPFQFFFGLVFPYLLVVMMAYTGARVVYRLGAEVSRARELGSYRLVERLGQGGMGEVWKAQHRLLARPAAIKLIRPTLADDGTVRISDDTRRRFEREAQVIARLRSPHTVDLFDFGIAADGAFYYVMELLEGLDAETLVRRTGPVPAARAIHLLRQICHSLSEAESCGLVHRDIKPATIFLCRYGEEFDFVKVLDFGIVKPTHETAETGVALTRELSVHGTPAYMAPEQALGDATLDGRADIYATGCVGYWLLTGQLVFEAPTPMGLLMHHAQTAPVPPSARTELPIPDALDRLILSCLEKDRALRPQTARELSRRLGEIDGAGAWTEEMARDWWGRHLPAV